MNRPQIKGRAVGYGPDSVQTDSGRIGMTRTFTTFVTVLVLALASGCLESKSDSTSSESLTSIGGQAMSSTPGGMQAPQPNSNMNQAPANGGMASNEERSSGSAGSPMTGGTPETSGGVAMMPDVPMTIPDSIMIEPGEISGPVGQETKLKVSANYAGSEPQAIAEGHHMGVFE